MTERKRRTYSLWLMPEGEVYDKFSHLIETLARRCESPSFRPHVTLVGGITSTKNEVISATERLSKSISPYLIKLEKVDYTDYFFRALFVRVKNTLEVQTAYDKAREVFPAQREESYMPHLSLMYGEFPDDLKQEIISEIGGQFNGEFIVSAIHLYQTERDKIGDWYEVAVFKLR